MKGYNRLRKRAIDLLESQLSKKLVYHGIHHTYDVLKSVNFFIKNENLPIEQAKQLRIAALYHDVGFIQTYREHEKKGVEILRQAMDEFGGDDSDFEIIAGMIMATKIPQNPKTHLEKIICDSDLFYLGEKRYYEISKTLFAELLNYNLIKTEEEWKKIQISFLSTHTYHTKYANSNLKKEKNKRVVEISKTLT